MFTGIAEETGKIQTIRENDIEIECKKVLEGTQIGDSIAVNGVCLTVVQKSENSFINADNKLCDSGEFVYYFQFDGSTIFIQIS